MQESQNTINFIKTWEEFRAKPYFDKFAKVWSIGYGTTSYPDGKGVASCDQEITEAQANGLLKYYVDICCFHANKAITATLGQPQFDACICLAYNIGATAFIHSTLLKTINENPLNLATIKSLWLRWDYSNGKTVTGLENRREAEYQMYASGFDDPDIMYT